MLEVYGGGGAGVRVEYAVAECETPAIALVCPTSSLLISFVIVVIMYTYLSHLSDCDMHDGVFSANSSLVLKNMR